jgi:dephospho-CoA kinase
MAYGAYDEGKLKRKKIADIVFQHPEMLTQLTEIVHPAVINHFNMFISNHQNDEFIFLESAVLFESGLNKYVDIKIVVTASEEERIKRVIARDKTNENEIKLRMKNQMKEQKLLQVADVIINTELEEINIEKLIHSIREIKTKKGTL